MAALDGDGRAAWDMTLDPNRSPVSRLQRPSQPPSSHGSILSCALPSRRVRCPILAVRRGNAAAVGV